jgi:hypothetical protein
MNISLYPSTVCFNCIQVYSNSWSCLSTEDSKDPPFWMIVICYKKKMYFLVQLYWNITKDKMESRRLCHFFRRFGVIAIKYSKNISTAVDIFVCPHIKTLKPPNKFSLSLLKLVHTSVFWDLTATIYAVVIIVRYRCFQLHTKFYAISFPQG